MPDDRFTVTLNGLDSKEIARYALQMMPCGACNTAAGVRCDMVTPGRPVCRPRFTDAVRSLGLAAETAIRIEFDKLEDQSPANAM